MKKIPTHLKRRLLGTAFALGAMLLSPAAAADEALFNSLSGRAEKPLIDPAGFYAVVLPSGFDCDTAPRKVRCRSNRNTQAQLDIDVVDVPVSASVELFLLNQEDLFKKKPHYRLLNKQTQKIDGTKAILATFTYDHNGNVELPVVAQALYMVKHTKAYVIHFEGRGETFAAHKRDLDRVYATFKTARLDGGGHPIIEDLEPKEADRNDGLPNLKKVMRGGGF